MRAYARGTKIGLKRLTPEPHYPEAVREKEAR
jgi:hypothetical protein